jgi:hypothetical protein
MDFGQKLETNCCNLDPQIRALPRRAGLRTVGFGPGMANLLRPSRPVHSFWRGRLARQSSQIASLLHSLGPLTDEYTP